MWVNRYDIAEFVEAFRGDPTLGPAAQFLDDYRELVDSVSDGWCHWSYGTKCADTLSTLLNDANSRRFRYDRNYVKPTWDDVKVAAQKIIDFVKNEPQLQGTEPPKLPDATQLTLC